MLVPSSDDDAGAQLILVVVTYGLEEGSDGVHGRAFAMGGSVHLAVVVHHVGNSLEVRRSTDSGGQMMSLMKGANENRGLTWVSAALPLRQQ